MFISSNNFLIKKWWVIFVLIDLLLVFITIAYPHLPDFSQKWRLVTPFSLHGENSIAVWWSGITLLLAAILCFDRFKNNSSTDKHSWLLLSIVMAGLSLDEIGSIHERVGLVTGWSGIIPFALILLCLVLYALFLLFKAKDTKLNATYILIAFALYGSVALQEFIEHIYTWPNWSTGLRVGIEEGCELLGTFLIIFSAVYKKGKNLSKHLSEILPNLNTLLDLKYIIPIGLAIHVIGCYIFLQIDNREGRGNPMAWYPSVVYFCSFLLCAWNSIHSEKSYEIWWRLLSFTCLLCSVGVMTNLFILIPGISKIISTSLMQENFIFFHFLQLFVATILIFKLLIQKYFIHIVALVTIVGIVILTTWLNGTLLKFLTLGPSSCYVYLLVTGATRKIKPSLTSK